jgi:phosphoribosylaminoimidazolecarboxamide formyltransferase/IMP cyclohydrolase
MKIQRALISLSDKAGIVEFARGLADLKIEILSTGGTARLLRDHGIPVVEVGDYTGQPEILDGRLKTLHPKIHGGILAMRDNAKHQEELKGSGIGPIDVLAVNLYPFEETIAKPGVSFEEAVENIDIGGPTMIRAAAKNWHDVAVVTDPADYPAVLEEIRVKGEVSPETKRRLAEKVFILTSRYDGAIANYLTGGREGRWPEAFNYQGRKVQELR